MTDSKAAIAQLLKDTPLDKNGNIKRPDLEQLLKIVVKDTVSEAELQRVLEIVDKDNTGSVPIDAFLTWVYGPGGAECIPWLENIILTSDSYKISHWKQYPPNTEYVYSYFESRGCDRKGWDSVCFFGLQYFLKRYMVGKVVTQEKIEEAAKIYSVHFGDGTNENPDMFFREGWEHILNKCDGKLPVHIKAVPEGMVIPNKTVLFTLVNTDPKCFWLSNFLETLLVQVWYPMTVCTNSRMQKISIQKYLEETGNEDWGIPGGSVFKLHDFGFRGVSSVESAATGGMGHLVNFLGTDTVAAMVGARVYYGAGLASGHSVPASEHSTITSWGVDGEVDAMRNMLTQYPDGIVACVSDSFNIWTACKEYWGTQLKDLIKGRMAGGFGRLVVRPDSGDPADTCTKIIAILLEQFKEDVTTTKTGHKLLPPYIRVLQGDGVDYETIPAILESLKGAGYAADNMVFGSGGALLQKVNRDTFKCAFKCSEITIAGKAREVFKDPITDSGKASKKGRLTLQLAEDAKGFSPEDNYKPRQGEDGIAGGTGFLHPTADGKMVTVASGKGDPSKDILVDVFKDGVLLKDWTLDEIRKRADVPNGPFSQ
jgi:nicotinamide phosphoribosyltransferase